MARHDVAVQHHRRGDDPRGLHRGRGRRAARAALNLLVEWKDERHAIEVKLRRDTETEADALEQVGRYLDHLGVDEGWMVMFDLRSTLSWSERLYTRTVEYEGKTVRIVGC